MTVLIIGLGSIAKKHITALKSLRPESSILILRSGRNQDEAEKLGKLTGWDEWEKKPDFAIISNPTNQHVQTLQQLADRGIPVMVEKPLSNSLEGLSDITARYRHSGLINYVACNMRFLPVLRFLKNWLLTSEYRINEVNVYCGSYLPEWRPGQDFRTVYSSRPELGGGVHLDLFHEFDYTCWLFGIPDEVKSLLGNKSSLQISAPDYANYQLIYPGFVAQMTLNYYRRDPKRTIEIVMESGTFTVDLLNNRLTDNTGNVIYSNDEFRIINTYTEQLSYFIGMLEGRNPPMNTLDESLQILQITLHHGKANG